jgi:hypothetical protein
MLALCEPLRKRNTLSEGTEPAMCHAGSLTSYEHKLDTVAQARNPHNSAHGDLEDG